MVIFGAILVSIGASMLLTLRIVKGKDSVCVKQGEGNCDLAVYLNVSQTRDVEGAVPYTRNFEIMRRRGWRFTTAYEQSSMPTTRKCVVHLDSPFPYGRTAFARKDPLSEGVKSRKRLLRGVVIG